jgi:hypothetical protein
MLGLQFQDNAPAIRTFHQWNATSLKLSYRLALFGEFGAANARKRAHSAGDICDA